MNTEKDFLTQLTSLVTSMRDAQKKYFRTRATTDLQAAKSLEKEVDSMLASTGDITTEQPNTLF